MRRGLSGLLPAWRVCFRALLSRSAGPSGFLSVAHPGSWSHYDPPPLSWPWPWASIPISCMPHGCRPVRPPPSHSLSSCITRDPVAVREWEEFLERLVFYLQKPKCVFCWWIHSFPRPGLLSIFSVQGAGHADHIPAHRALRVQWWRWTTAHHIVTGLRSRQTDTPFSQRG